jgi:hypothetical protein
VSCPRFSRRTPEAAFGRLLPVATGCNRQPTYTLAEQLGCVVDDCSFGPSIHTDASNLTSVPDLNAAEDIARAPHNATWLAADGVKTGTSLHQALVFT